jgi:hypothetical protein
VVEGGIVPETERVFQNLSAVLKAAETLDDLDRPRQSPWPRHVERKAAEVSHWRFHNIAHLWSSYTLQSAGKQVARGINSIQAIKEAGGWRVTGIMVQAESVTAPLPKEYLP